MPEGVGYEVWTDTNPPQGDDPLLQEGFLWEHPSAGKVFYNPKTKNYQPLDDAQWEQNARPPAAPPADAQAEVIEGVVAPATPTAPAAVAPADPSLGGTGTTTANRSRFTSGAARAGEKARAGTEAGVQNYEATRRHQEADPMFGLSMEERAAAGQLAVAEQLTDAEAAERIRAMREATAEDQAVAIEE